MKSNAFIIMMFAIQLLSATEKSKKSNKTTLPNQNSILWEISGNNLKAPSYLFGTIHAIPYDDFFIGKNTIKKLKACEQLVMELDLTEINEAKLTELSLLPEDKNIKDFISDKEYNDLEEFLIQKFGMSKAIFENVYSKLKPFYVEQFILLSIIGENKKVYENELNDLASENNIGKIGLEKFEEQLAIIDSIPLKLQYQNLVKNLHNYDEQITQYNEMVQAYKKQDLNYLNEQFENNFTGDMSIYKIILLDDRNEKWIAKIEQIASKKTSFFAVGAGHLAGKNGLIKLLQNKGFTVTPISTN